MICADNIVLPETWYNSWLPKNWNRILFVSMFPGLPKRERRESQGVDTQADSKEAKEEGVVHDMRILCHLKRSNTVMQWKLTLQCVSRPQEEASFPEIWNRVLLRVTYSFPCFLLFRRENKGSHKGWILKQTRRREQRRELFMTCANDTVLPETW